VKSNINIKNASSFKATIFLENLNLYLRNELQERELGSSGLDLN